MRVSRFVACSLVVLAIASSLQGPAAARQWRTTPDAEARQYTQVFDNRSKTEIVFVWWVAPETVAGQSPDDEKARSLLRQYLIVAVAHLRTSPLGQNTYERPVGVLIQTQDGKARQPFVDRAIPPAVTGIIATFQAVFSQMAGQFGQGTHWYVFDGKGIESCQKGAFWVYYAGERYGYDTPIPGCGQSTAGSPQG